MTTCAVAVVRRSDAVAVNRPSSRLDSTLAIEIVIEIAIVIVIVEAMAVAAAAVAQLWKWR